MQIVSNNLRAMSRWCPFLAVIVAATAFACNDELTQDVSEDVCISSDSSGAILPGTQWVGGRRASPEMYPGRDCVGCHLENDGPEFMLGGTVYPFLNGDFRTLGQEAPTGDDCFGLEGVTVKITGGDDQVFVTTSNRAGNFFVEGRPNDLKKPFRVEISFQPAYRDQPIVNPMVVTTPSYGGCGRCHSPDAQPFPARGEEPEDFSEDERVSPAGGRIGVAGLLRPSM